MGAAAATPTSGAAVVGASRSDNVDVPQSCSGKVGTVDSRGRGLNYALDGGQYGVAAKLLGGDGRIGARTQALAFAGEWGDVATGTRHYFAVNQAGRPASWIRVRGRPRYCAARHRRGCPCGRTARGALDLRS